MMAELAPLIWNDVARKALDVTRGGIETGFDWATLRATCYAS